MYRVGVCLKIDMFSGYDSPEILAPNSEDEGDSDVDVSQLKQLNPGVVDRSSKRFRASGDLAEFIHQLYGADISYFLFRCCRSSFPGDF